MSLVFRSVKKISKKRKTGSKNKSRKCCKDPFEDNPTKFIVEDEENRSDFPSLNSLYKTALFGTPLPFRSGNGYDCLKFLKIKTKLQSIVFMNEYMNKSFEELRWEDYQCNRKGSHIFQERNYLKCLSKDVEAGTWKTNLTNTKKYDAEPLPGIANSKFPVLTNKTNTFDARMDKVGKTVTQQPKIILQRPKELVEKRGKSSKERSILTNVNKLCPLKEVEFDKPPEIERKKPTVIKSNSDINLTTPKREEMVRDNLQRYFSGGYSNTSVPYEFYSQNNNYFLPCTNISLAYKNKERKLSTKNQCPGFLWDLIKSNPFGYSSIYDKLNPLIGKGTLYEKLFGLPQLTKTKKMFESTVEKYTPENKFNKKYFWSQFSPYARDGRCIQDAVVQQCTKSKKYWSGIRVTA